jgi:drug/metabolite transporter (DMT)-like permease
MNPTMGPREWLLLLALALLWGGSFFFAELALMELRPLTVVLGRVGFAALALWAVLALSGRRLPASPRLWGAFLVMGALNNAIPFSLIVWAQVELDSGLAAILNATTPLFTVLLAHLVTAEERLTWNRVAGVLLGLGGVAVLIGPTALTGLGLAGLSQIAVLAAALSYACAGLYGRRFRGLPPSSAAAGMLTASTVLLLPSWTAPGPSLPARRAGPRCSASRCSARRWPTCSTSASWPARGQPTCCWSPS